MMHCLRGLICVALLLTTAAAHGEVYAFLAICSKYDQKATFNDLPRQLETGREFKDVLIQSGIHTDNVFHLENPTYADIKLSMAVLNDRLSNDDQLIVLFSGHGVQRGTEPEFCPVDALETGSLNNVKISDLNSWLEDPQFEVRKELGMIVFLDCCRSNNDQGPSGRLQAKIDLGKKLKRMIVICSCERGAEGLTDVDSRRSYFMDSLILGWKGAAGAADKDGDELISLIEYFTFVSDQTQSFQRLRLNLKEGAEPHQKPTWFFPPEQADVDLGIFNIPFLRITDDDVEIIKNSLPFNWRNRGSFAKTVFTDVSFQGETIEGMDFTAAVFNNVTFEAVIFVGADFTSAHFNNCTFIECGFKSRVAFGSATFDDCTFRDSDFTGTTGLAIAKFRGNCQSLESTLWPGKNKVPKGVKEN